MSQGMFFVEPGNLLSTVTNLTFNLNQSASTVFQCVSMLMLAFS